MKIFDIRSLEEHVLCVIWRIVVEMEMSDSFNLSETENKQIIDIQEV